MRRPWSVSALTAATVSGSPGLARRLLRKPSAVVTMIVLGVIVAAVAAAPLIAPYGPDQANLLNPLAAPSWSHLLGTDELGRDTFSRLLYGGRPTLIYALEASVVTFVIGLPLGMLAGFKGGRTDRVLMGINDVGMSAPVIILVLLVLSVFENDFWLAMITLGIAVSPPLIRNVRGATLTVRNELFIDAARVSGLSNVQIIRRHVLPRIQGAVLVQLTLNCALSVLFTVSLGFLGFGVQAPSASWGSMTAEAGTVLARSPWLLIASGGITGIFVLCLGLLGDAIRDAAVEVWSGMGTAAPAARRRRAPRGVTTTGAAHTARGATTTGAAHTPRGATAAGRARPLPSPSGDALLSMRDVAIAFPRAGREVLVADGIDLDIAPGESVGLVGESGCGKTSVARAVIRLLRGGGRVVSGSIWFAGQDVLALSARELRGFRGTSVGYISQEPMVALDPSYRVGSLLLESIRSHTGLSGKDATRRVHELLELVHLPRPAEVARMYPHELSGGMAQRVAIARALAGSPRLLIADEPTTALDVTVQAEILKLLAELRVETGMAILLVSHDWTVVGRLCERAIVMYAGQVVEHASVHDLLTTAAHPYTQGLLACRPSSLPAGSHALPAIPGTVPDPEAWPPGCRFADRCRYRAEACSAAPIELLEPGGEHTGRRARCLRVDEIARTEEPLHA